MMLPFLSSRIRPPPSAPLFPYTTLFRSVSNALQTASSPPKLRSVKPSPSSSKTLRPEVSGWGAKRSEEHTSELQSHHELVCRLLLEKKKAKWPQLPFLSDTHCTPQHALT